MTSVEQLLTTISAATQGNTNTVVASGAGANTGGVAGASLRGLGSQRTLVLINGRRISAGGTLTDSTTVDVNSIPLAAVERVEVLKDGASAIYGSDAIAGVINFILRKDKGGGRAFTMETNDEWTVSCYRLGGFRRYRNGPISAMIIGSYQKDKSLFGGIEFREIIKGANNDTTSREMRFANIVIPGVGLRNPDAPNNCASSKVRFG